MTKRERGEIAEIKLRCREVLRVQLERKPLQTTVRSTTRSTSALKTRSRPISAPTS
jgi:hypothetical protein